jgi:hypothetical protein
MAALFYIEKTMIPQHILKDFKEEFADERYLVDAIKQYLLSPEHKAMLDARGVSIEDVLNGRVRGDDQDSIYKMLNDDWNGKIGFVTFGFDIS